MEQLFANVSSITRKCRIGYLKSIGVVSPTNYDVLKDIQAIKSKIESSNNPKTRATRVFHITTFLELVGDTKLLQPYTKLMSRYKNESINAQLDNTIANDKKADRYTDIEDLQKMLLISKPKLVQTPTLKDIKTFQKYLLLSFYVLQPPIRNDLANLTIVSAKKHMKDRINYLVITPRVIYVYLYKFKNSSSFKDGVRVDLDDEIKDSIRYVMKLYKQLKLTPLTLINSFVLQSKTQAIRESEISPASENAIQKMITRYSKELFPTQMSINDFRHAWEIKLQNSEEYKHMSLAQREQEHKKLLHSTTAALTYNRVRGDINKKKEYK